VSKSRSTRTKKPKASYHHGDLHRALVEAGLELVRSKGVEALSLRAVARLAKVSHNAPYHHFHDKAELLAAVAAAGFELLVESIGRQAQQDQARTGMEALRAVGRGYLAFAFEHPPIFRLMFRPEMTRPADHRILREAEAAAFGTLLHTITLCQQEGDLPGKDPLPPAAACWSIVHGLAMLHVDQVLNETPLGDVPLDQLVDTVIETVIAGVVSGTSPSSSGRGPG
jgi:AcrR family transcriptional regulator